MVSGADMLSLDKKLEAVWGRDGAADDYDKARSLRHAQDAGVCACVCAVCVRVHHSASTNRPWYAQPSRLHLRLTPCHALTSVPWSAFPPLRSPPLSAPLNARVLVYLYVRACAHTPLRPSA
jgi:hypothetical protein